MRPIETSSITLSYCSSRENSFLGAYLVQLNCSAIGQEKSSRAQLQPLYTIRPYLEKDIRVNDLLFGVPYPCMNRDVSTTSFPILVMLDRIMRMTPIYISFFGKKLRLIVSIHCLDGKTTVTVDCPSGGIENTREWSSEFLENFRSLEIGRQTAIPAC